MKTDNSAIRKNWPEHYGDPEWFIHDRFGLFIHFGLYSNAARHEWVMKWESIHPDTYRKYFERFDPDRFDPKEWARTAKKAGLKYFVITTKHHDGFCLWDTAYTDYKVTNTPAKRDLLKEIVEAFRAEGLKVGFYHSLLDWHHPEFPVDGTHPQSGDEDFKKAAAGRDMSKYVEYLHNQVRELLTNYGKVDYLWFDFSYPKENWGWSVGKGAQDWQSEKLEKLCLELQPHIILNDRLDLQRGIQTPEQYQPLKPLVKDGHPVLWEACQAMNGSWGYHRDNLDWKSSEMLIKMLIDTVSKDGNLLLNVGPNARGEIEPLAKERLEVIGEWMDLHSTSIYGTKNSDFVTPVDCRYTQRGDRLYLHIFSWPFKHIHLPGLAGQVKYAQFLHDGSELFFKEHNPNIHVTHMTAEIEPGSITIELPVQKPDVIVPVVELFLKTE